MTELVRQLGALGVFLLMVPESACIPIPSEVTLLFAGFAVGQGWLSFPRCRAGRTAGNLVGSMIAYRSRRIGSGGARARRRRGGLPLGRAARTPRQPRRLHRPTAAARSLVRFICRPGAARSARRVRGADSRGCAIWAAGFILIGMAAGNAWTAIGSVLGKILLGVGITVLVLTLGRR